MVNLKESLELMKLLRIDVFMALFMFAYGMVQVPHVEFIQDKICLNELGKDDISCGTLTSGEPTTDQLQSIVLTLTTSIVNYQTLISAIPGVIQSFFFGYWIDKYPSHIRALLIIPCIGLLTQSLIMIYQCIYFDVPIIYSLWAHLAFGLGGGQSLILASAFTYAAKKTPQKFRSIRFAFIDLFIFTAYPIGVNVSGKILAANPWFTEERRNFAAVFTTSAAISMVAIIWALIFINDSGSSDEGSDDQPNAVAGPSTTETTMTEIDLNDGSRKEQSKAQDQFDTEKGTWAIAADIFNFRNVKITIKTFLRDRPNNGRKKVVLLVSCVLGIFVSLIAESYFGFQYVEKAFLWDYKYYSNIYAYLQLVQSFCTVAGSLVLKNILKLGDAEVSAIGTLSHFLGNLIKGLPFVACFISGSLAFSLSGIAIPAIRSSITRIIEYNEIGQFLAIISCMQALGPLVASTQTTAIFTSTIDTAPGTTYHFLAASMIPPLIVQLWVSFSSESTEERRSSTKVRFEVGDENETVDIQGLGDSEGERKF